MSWTSLGVRYRKVMSRRSRWGEPKVHLIRWMSADKRWETVCNEGSEVDPGYPDVPDTATVTCKRCADHPRLDYKPRIRRPAAVTS